MSFRPRPWRERALDQIIWDTENYELSAVSVTKSGGVVTHTSLEVTRLPQVRARLSGPRVGATILIASPLLSVMFGLVAGAWAGIVMFLALAAVAVVSHHTGGMKVIQAERETAAFAVDHRWSVVDPDLFADSEQYREAVRHALGGGLYRENEDAESHIVNAAEAVLAEREEAAGIIMQYEREADQIIEQITRIADRAEGETT